MQGPGKAFHQSDINITNIVNFLVIVVVVVVIVAVIVVVNVVVNVVVVIIVIHAIVPLKNIIIAITDIPIYHSFLRSVMICSTQIH